MRTVRIVCPLLCCLFLHSAVSATEPFYRTYKCHEYNKCVRTSRPVTADSLEQNTLIKNNEHSTIEACRLTCNPAAGLWPIPTGQIFLSKTYVPIHPSHFTFDVTSVPEACQQFVNEAIALFSKNVKLPCKDSCAESSVQVTVRIDVTSSDLTLDWDTNETYRLAVNPDEIEGTNLDVRIVAPTVYGTRHGLETLLQLTAPIQGPRGSGIVILRSATISDGPVYPHRGLMIDSARNFLPVNDILRTIDGLAASKMNVLHWHVTDSQSFPLEIPGLPLMTAYGAYGPDKIYTVDDTHFVIKYAKQRGIRVIVELDAPSHSGAGYEWGADSGLGNLVVCAAAEPWNQFCIQPPCGQLNVANPKLYDVLRDIYKYFISAWGSKAVFHMGGDEVFIPCWNATTEITVALRRKNAGVTTQDFINLWAEFQAILLNHVDQLRGPDAGNVSAILWSSELTNPATIERYLNKKRYVIHTWVPSASNVSTQLLDLGYRLIMTTKDAWYLDHGFWGTTRYYTWRVAYANRLPRRPGVLGGEAASWGEYQNGFSLDARVWPRTAAVAERLWSDPISTSTASAEPRIQSHRNRLARRGIKSEAISPEWCAQHDGQC